jgi:hypothetical protein
VPGFSGAGSPVHGATVHGGHLQVHKETLCPASVPWIVETF